MTKKIDDDLLIYIVIFGAIILWYFIRRDQPPQEVARWWFEVWVILTIWVTSEMFVWKGRYKAPQFVCNGISGSVLQRPFVEDGYAIFGLGETNEPIHMEGKLATVVVPVDMLYRAGNNYCSLTQVIRKAGVQFLPPRVSEHIIHNKDKYSQDRIYFGIYSEKYIHDNSDKAKELDELEDAWNSVNLRARHIENDDDLLIEKFKTGETIAGKPNAIEKVVNKLKQDGNE